jgi:predicted nucleotide-binding protein
MEEKSYIQSLIEEVDKLNYNDEDALDKLRRKSNMIIRRLFGDASHYLKDLNSISFISAIYPTSHDLDRQHWLSGKHQMSNLLHILIEELELFGSSTNNTVSQRGNDKLSNNIFIVHGKDDEMKQAVARFIEKAELKPVILHEQPNEGRTVLEKFETHSDCQFAVVLLSPDDAVYPEGEKPENTKPENAKYRARQNAIFELGFFNGRLGRGRVAVIFRKAHNFDMPSDINGIAYIPYDGAGAWKSLLGKELKRCGYEVDMNKLI